MVASFRGNFGARMAMCFKGLAHIAVLLLALSPIGLGAQNASLFATSLLSNARQPLFGDPNAVDRNQSKSRAGSLLPSGVAVTPVLTAAARPYTRHAGHWPRGTTAPLLDLIAEAEAGPLGYDAVQYGARRKPERSPTQMTIAQIFQWIDETPGQPHAIGRYQFIPDTLAYLVAKLDIRHEERFSPALQDRLATELLMQAGFGKFTEGRISRVKFMNGLARIWAGLPNSTGRSHYHGHAGNRATMTWSYFDQEMLKLFPS